MTVKILFIVSYMYKRVSSEIMKCRVKNTQNIARLWNLPSEDIDIVKNLHTLQKKSG